MRITSEIVQVGGSGISENRDAAVYLIHVGGEAALVDAGCGGSTERILGNVREAGVDPASIRLLLITHCHFDHTGGAAALRGALGCRTAAHALEAPFLEHGDDTVTAARWYGATLAPFPVDVVLEGAQAELAVGGRPVRAIHVPGHSPGSVVYLVESEGLTVLFGQDVHGPLDAAIRSDPAAYRASLERMVALEADVLCEGHYGVFRGKDKVRAFIRSFL